MSNGQRGVIAPVWLYLAGAIALIAALTGLVVAWNNYTAKLVKGGYDRGVAETNAAYTARDNKQLQALVVAERQAQTRAAQAEAIAAAAQTDASVAYHKGVDDAKRKTAALVAAAKSGALRLRDPGQAGTCPTIAATTTQGAATGPARGSDAGAQTGLPATTSGLLSTEASDFLLGLTGEADDTARQLTAAQAIIVSDRKLCNAP